MLKWENFQGSEVASKQVVKNKKRGMFLEDQPHLTSHLLLLLTAKNADEQICMYVYPLQPTLRLIIRRVHNTCYFQVILTIIMLDLQQS